ncbi:hypothetical protein NIES37_53560 [Tolypothrix tenuis PCC 7101]|uniref:DUF3134 domain-containing protein n=1 Tax=Tolypothrix tenuis PCC 7101 TaxID=231146 RepID=A0A1Z4N6M4_9CYAN|nr:MULTISPECIES: DUF3134 domain-containing protein [unclassified Tolypothrix]MBD2208570.1 DUF3134 domain-containing protein [Nostoc linckia FACHB-104]MBD2241460.1 DUF3134 domain-containing protein [Aulosira sp. FACHB-113]MBD2336865.1 DUF3134 domain-containing protein [Calothrix sp. FACHB-156]BAY33992.1 hypothetical protein NIES2107_58970 [Nostoc carneum NIES-2107]BAY92273.1 hypothetical protein NIES3275_43070 [Microchaete diplosiphon NIES-3275]BAZ01357.1 hypothetical protein NIES37_53560 [Tol
MLNSPLREEPRNQRAAVIPLKQETSLIDWLQSSGRIIARDVHEPDFQDEEEEISEFLGGEDGIADFDDDDDDIGIAED